jgi:transcriptional regulator with XRE-family HTH domain
VTVPNSGPTSDDSPGAEQLANQAGRAIDMVTDLGKELTKDIGEYIRQQREHASISLRQLARLAGVSNPYLSQVERGLRKPSAEILQQIAKGLRISAEALYIQAGILDEPTGGPVGDAIRAATELTERQKQVLLDIYETFLRNNDSTRSTAEGSDVDGKGDIDRTPDPEE